MWTQTPDSELSRRFDRVQTRYVPLVTFYKKRKSWNSCERRANGNILDYYWCVCDKFFKAQIHYKNPPEGTNLNELYKKRPGTSQMSEIFGPNFAPGSFALRQSIRFVYTLRALSRGRNRATRATRDNQMYTHTERAHTRSATETQHNSQPETPTGSWPLLLPRRRHRRRRRCRHRRCCCCCCCCCCAAA